MQPLMILHTSSTHKWSQHKALTHAKPPDKLLSQVFHPLTEFSAFRLPKTTQISGSQLQLTHVILPTIHSPLELEPLTAPKVSDEVHSSLLSWRDSWAKLTSYTTM